MSRNWIFSFNHTYCLTNKYKLFFLNKKKKEQKKKKKQNHQRITKSSLLTCPQSGFFYKEEKRHTEKKEQQMTIIWSYHGWEAVVAAEVAIDGTPVEWCSSPLAALFAIDELVDERGDATISLAHSSASKTADVISDCCCCWWYWTTVGCWDVKRWCCSSAATYGWCRWWLIWEWWCWGNNSFRTELYSWW